MKLICAPTIAPPKAPPRPTRRQAPSKPSHTPVPSKPCPVDPSPIPQPGPDPGPKRPGYCPLKK